MASCLDGEDETCQNFADLFERLDSFYADSCPRDFFNSKQDLADAGFYYAGNRKLICYSCQFMKRWESGLSVTSIDDIICEHAISFNCNYIKQTQAYVIFNTSKKVEHKTIESQLGRPGNSEPDQNEARQKHQRGQRPSETVKYGTQCTEKSLTPATSTFIDDDESANSDLNRDNLVAEHQRLRRECCCNNCLRNEKRNLLKPCNHHLCSTCFTTALTVCPVCRDVITKCIPFTMIKKI